MKSLVAGIRVGYRAFQGGKFNDAKAAISDILVKIPLVVTSSRNEASEVKDILEISREYITAIRIKGTMSVVQKDPVCSSELSTYFTHCNLQPNHLLLALQSAIGTSFKRKNFSVAASFTWILLELPDMNSQRNAELRVKVICGFFIFFSKMLSSLFNIYVFLYSPGDKSFA